MKKFIECPICGKQDLIEIGGGIIRRFDTALVDPSYKRALKGDYHTWTCDKCGRKFIRSNVLCDCIMQSEVLKLELSGIVLKSRRPKPKFTCSKCGGKVSLEWLDFEVRKK